MKTQNCFTPLHPESPSLQAGDEWQIKFESTRKPRPKGWGVTGFTDFLKRGILLCLDNLQEMPFYGRMLKPLNRDVEINIADEVDIKNIYKWFGYNFEPSVSPDTDGIYLAAKKNKKIVGFVQLAKINRENNYFPGWWLFGLYVRVSYRRLGIGDKLTRDAIEKAANNGAKELFLTVYEDNYKAINLYGKLGFKRRISPGMEEILEKERVGSNRRRILLCNSILTLGVPLGRDVYLGKQ